MRNGRAVLGALTVLMLFCLLNTATATSYLAYAEDVPLFVQFFVIFMALYHATMFIMLKEIQRVSSSTLWNSLRNANYLGIVLTLVTASLLYELAQASAVAHYILVFAAVFDVATHYLANIALYYLITPIIKEKIELSREKCLIYYAAFVIALYLISNTIYTIKYPLSPHFIVLFLFIIFSILIVLHYSSILLYISKGYIELGFVRKPFFIGGIGMISYLLSISFIVYYIFRYLDIVTQKSLYYDIMLYPIFFIFTILYFMQFVIEYPALLEPRWKVLMPFDIAKVTAIATLFFLSVSIYFSSRVHPNFVIYQTIPYYIVPILSLPIAVAIIFIIIFMRLLYAKTKLIYWQFLRFGLFVHLAVTFYMVSLITLLWDTATDSARMLGLLFGCVSFLFYLFFALDLRSILVEQKIRPVINKIDIVQVSIAFYSCLFIIFFGVSFIYEGDPSFASPVILPNPILLFLVAFFLISFGTYLSITHKGFEEIMKKNIWSELSYIFAFIVFLLVYLIYSAAGMQMQQFQYHNIAFVGYFIVLIIEIVSTWTLAEKSKIRKKEKVDIVDLLNYHARSFLRIDYLEDLWKRTVAQLVSKTEQTKIKFDPVRRSFDLTALDDATRVTVAVNMLLQMHKLNVEERISLQRTSHAEIKEEIVKILKEKIVELPKELSSEFEEDLYYPLLLEKSINDLFGHLRTFIPTSEQEMIFEGLRRRDEFFACIKLEAEEIRVIEGTRFGRDKFLEMFKLYLEAIGEKFPFKRCLLRGLVKDEISTHALFAASEVFDIISTGIKELNLIMAGGLVKGSSTLLIAEETKAKQKMIHSLMKRNLLEGTSIIYATSKRPYRQIQGELLMELDSMDRVTILDLYEPLYEEKGISELIEYEQHMLVPLNKILFQRSLVKVIKSQSRTLPRIVIIDVYDDFAKYYQPEETHGLLQNQLEGLKRWNCTTVFVLAPHSHLLKKVGRVEVEKHFDNILILSGVEKESIVHIEKLFQGTPSRRALRLD